MFVHFLYLPKENEPAAKRRKKGQPITWFDYVELPCVSRNDREFENPLRSNSSNSCSGHFCGTWLRDMALKNGACFLCLIN